MGRRTILIAATAVLVACAFGAGYLVGRGDRTTVPDLFGMDRGSPEATRSYVTLKKSDLRLGRERLSVCGDSGSSGMVVRQLPAAGESVPVGSSVEVWRAISGSPGLFADPDDPERPCHHP